MSLYLRLIQAGEKLRRLLIRPKYLPHSDTFTLIVLNFFRLTFSFRFDFDAKFFKQKSFANLKNFFLAIMDSSGDFENENFSGSFEKFSGENENFSGSLIFNQNGNLNLSIKFYLYVLRYFIIITMILGLVINFLCFFALIRQKFRYKCFPYLCGLIAGNLCFLFFFAFDNFVANFLFLREFFRPNRIFCQIEFYLVAVCKQIHHLFIAAACIQHYFSLFPLYGKLFFPFSLIFEVMFFFFPLYGKIFFPHF